MGTQRRYRPAVVDVDTLLIDNLSDLQEAVARFVHTTDRWQALRCLDDVNDAWIAFGDALDTIFQYLAWQVRQDYPEKEEL